MSSSAGPATAADASATVMPTNQPHTLAHATRARLVVLAAGMLVLAVGFWLWILWHAINLHQGKYDFSTYYAAGRALRLDPHANIYSPPVLAASSIAGHVLAPPNQPYLYPPLPALLFAPLTLFSFSVAADIFLAVNILVWLLCMLLLAREVRHLLGISLATGDKRANGWLARLLADPAPLVALGICAPLFFLGRPGEWTLGNGQINFLVLLPLAAVPWLTRRGNERSVGVAIALATMLKLTPGVLLLYLLLRRRWQALGAALIALAALALLSLLIVGPQVFLAFPGAVLRTGNHAATQSHNEALFAPVIYALASANAALASPARLCEYALLGVLAVELGVILWRTRPAGPSGSTGAIHLSAEALRSEALAYALALPAIVLLSPTAWAHHYVWLLPAAAIVVGLAIHALATHPAHTSGGRALWALLIVGLLAGVLLNLPLPNGWDTDPTALQWLFGLPLRPWFQELRPLGGLLVIAIAATLLPRAQTAISPPESQDNDRQVSLFSVPH